MDDMMIIKSGSFDACFNLAFEEYILDCLTEKSKYILFLWRNDNAVIIGRNQNACNECNLEAMKKYGTRLVRRNTGGGAVYHDLGNLNFSIFCPKECYDIKRSAGVVRRAVGRFGVMAEYSGRNDLLVNGRKFSGNAFLSGDRTGLHHGTILLHTDLIRMEEVLRAPREKLEPRGIASVRSRVINLCEINGNITAEQVGEIMICEFMEEYEHSALCMVGEKQMGALVEDGKLDALVKKYSSDVWNLGGSYSYNRTGKGRFSWGQCEIRLLVEQNVVLEIDIETDALVPEDIIRTADWLKGMSLKRLKEEDTLWMACKETGADAGIIRDILGLVNRM